MTWTAAAPYVTVLAPTSSDTLVIGSQFTIEWETNDPGFDANILLYVEGGWREILYSESPPPDGRWTWTVGNDGWGDLITFSTPATDCRIRVRHYFGGVPFGESGTFTINAP